MEQGKRVIALGFFDGVHLGHGALLRTAAQRASELGVEPAVISFDIPPSKTIDNAPVPLINSPLDRADIMKRFYGIDDLIFLHFDYELRHMEWWRFIEWLKSDFGAVHLVAGYDFRFGYKGAGNVQLLREKCAELNMGVDIVEKISYGGAPISSTRIRALLSEGRCQEANELLGHRHLLTDFVRYGYRFGRTLGTPTINMRFEDGVLIPRHGVYIAEAHILDSGKCFEAVTNIGVRPTVGGEDAVSVESHLLGYSGNLYGRKIRVEFHKFLRPEMKFERVELLRDQIRRDAAETQAYFNKLTDGAVIDPFDYPEWK
ncbi:MAG: riboflavin biosynthesis protein RibF [Oscillospiraceae bacterium]